MNNKCQLCESDVRQDLVPIHIKHYHNIPQCNIIISLVRRIEALEKQVEDLKKENSKLLGKNSMKNSLSPELSHLELKKLCQNVRQLGSFYYKTVMAMIIGGDTSNSTLKDKNDIEEDLEKVIVNLEPRIAVRLSNCVNEYQSSTVSRKCIRRSAFYSSDRPFRRYGVWPYREATPLLHFCQTILYTSGSSQRKMGNFGHVVQI